MYILQAQNQNVLTQLENWVPVLVNAVVFGGIPEYFSKL